MENTTKQRRSSIKIMGKMIGLVKPLAHIMTAAVLLGTLGYLCAIFLTITAGHGVLLAMKGQRVTKYLIILVVLAVMRGILHYAEQYCNHFIAFKLLAIIRHQVFAVLRKLCPAKLDGREKGNLISIITTDIELLEVFYAHTISPIMIAILTSLIMVVFIGKFHVYAGIFAVCSYLLVGCVIPLWNGSKGGQKGMEFRSGFGNLNSFVLESLRGIDETIQYGQGKKRKAQISEKSIELGKMQKDLNCMEAMQRAVTDLVILCCSFGMFFLMYHLYQAGNVTFDAMLLATIAMMGSFGPVTALSSLSNNLIDFDTPIHVVKGLEGDSMDELIQNLKTKKVLGLEAEANSGVDIKTVDIPYQARLTKLELDEKNIYRFGMGLNTSGLKDTNATTNIAIKAAYSLLDLKCSKLEIRLMQFLRKLIKPVLSEINERNKTDYQMKDIYFDFKHEVMSNAQENAQIALTEAQAKQTEINTLLNLASNLDNETLMQNICGVLDIDYEEIKNRLPEQEDFTIKTALEDLNNE